MTEDEPKKQPPFQIGQDLAGLSVEELRTLADQLRGEITRLEQAASARAQSLSAADAFFRR